MTTAPGTSSAAAFIASTATAPAALSATCSRWLQEQGHDTEAAVGAVPGPRGALLRALLDYAYVFSIDRFVDRDQGTFHDVGSSIAGCNMVSGARVRRRICSRRTI